MARYLSTGIDVVNVPRAGVDGGSNGLLEFCWKD